MAYRARQAAAAEHRIAPEDEQQLLAEYDSVTARQLADSLSPAAERIAGALTAGQPADDHDLGVLARLLIVLAARADQIAAFTSALPTLEAEPTVTVLDLGRAPRPDRTVT